MLDKIKQNIKFIDPYFYMDFFTNYLHKKGINSKILDITIYIVYSLLLAILILKILGMVLGTSEAMMIVVSESMEPKLNIGDIAVLINPKVINSGYEIRLNEDLNNKTIDKFVKLNYKLDNKIIDNKQVTLLVTESIDINGINYPLKQDGDIIVYYTDLLHKKIIHRAIIKLIANDGIYYITKGDNKLTNTLLDADCGIDQFNEITRNCVTLYPIREDKVLAKYWFKIPYLGYIKILPINFIQSLFS